MILKTDLEGLNYPQMTFCIYPDYTEALSPQYNQDKFLKSIAFFMVLAITLNSEIKQTFKRN